MISHLVEAYHALDQYQGVVLFLEISCFVMGTIFGAAIALAIVEYRERPKRA